MVSAERHDLPVYTLADLPPRARHVLLAPAVRWRVVVEQVVEIEHDVILDTVLRIRAAGEASPTRIADLLQLPEDLVRHLLAQAAAGGMQVAGDGRLQKSSSTVAWIYRDLATGELWPDPAAEVPPLPVRFTSRYRARFDRGTAGRPIAVECLLLDTPEITAAEPTSIELARFSRASADRNRRTAIVSSGETCLVASRVVGLTTGCAVEATRGVPHLSLSQQLTRAGLQYEAVSRWLAGVPKAAAAAGADLPLRRAVSELRDVAAAGTPKREAFEPVTILSRVELCLGRFADQFQYLHGVPVEADLPPGAVAVLSGQFGLTRDAAGLMARSGRGTVGFKVACLLAAQPGRDQAMLRDLAAAAAQFADLAQATDASPALARLVEATIALCDRLVTASEDADVRQAG